ncbi:MFS transporter [Halomonas sabkhae]|uniref:MFS transporter n=1 Tax=Halomonas sabkhae TaxID=626223 RepID=UPI00338EAB4D
MKSLSSTGFAIFGAALIAITYGLARFAFGLFVPQIRDELALSTYVIGIIGSLPLISFLLATAVAPLITNRLGARYTAVLSGLFGVAGLLLISRASDAMMLGSGVFSCGISTGLMMPALTAGMQAIVKRSMHGRVSSVMNAGTSIGLIVAVPTVLFMVGAWRLAYLSFAICAALGVMAAWLFLPSVSQITPANAAPPAPLRELPWSRLIRLTIFAFVMGFVSSAYWIFAPDLVVTLGGLSSASTGWLWLAVGIAGLGGAVAADLADRNNPPITHALMLMMLAASLVLLAASPAQTVLATFSALVFGLAYMSLTGLYLMTGIRLLPGRLSVGPVLPFMAVSLGQAAGSPVVGALVDAFDYAGAFSIFASLGILVAILSPFYPGHIYQVGDEEIVEEDTGLQAAYDHQLQNEEGEPLEDPEDPQDDAEQTADENANDDVTHPISLHPHSNRVRVYHGDTLLADTGAAIELREKGYPPRHYIPTVDVDMSRLSVSATVTHCPFKGDSTYYSLPDLADIAWSYDRPNDDMDAIAGYLAFDADKVTERVE